LGNEIPKTGNLISHPGEMVYRFHWAGRTNLKDTEKRLGGGEVAERGKWGSGEVERLGSVFVMIFLSRLEVKPHTMSYRARSLRHMNLNISLKLFNWVNRRDWLPQRNRLRPREIGSAFHGINI